MKRRIIAMILTALCLLSGCAGKQRADKADILAMTAPVAQMVSAIVEGSGLTVATLISEPVSCLHDYSLSVAQMETVEQAKLVVLSGAGLEEFMGDTLAGCETVVDASEGVALLPGEEGESDPHIWLSPENMIAMTQNVEAALAEAYPAQKALFARNAETWIAELRALQAYGEEQLAALGCRELVTFHDGFSYFARAFGLEVAAAMEIEEGSEPSAKEIESVIRLVETEAIPAVFCEENGERQTAETVARQTGAGLFALTMGMDGGAAGCTDAIYHNIDIIREALS